MIIVTIANIIFSYYKLGMISGNVDSIKYYSENVSHNKSNPCFAGMDCYQFKDAKMNDYFKNDRHFFSNAVFMYAGVQVHLNSVFALSALLLGLVVFMIPILRPNLCKSTNDYSVKFVYFYFLSFVALMLSIVTLLITLNRNVPYFIFRDTVSKRFTLIDNYLFMESLGSEYKNYKIEGASCSNTPTTPTHGLKCYLDVDLFKRTENYNAFYPKMVKWIGENDKIDIYITIGLIGSLLLVNIISPIIHCISNRCVVAEDRKKEEMEQKNEKNRRRFVSCVDDNIYRSSSIETIPSTGKIELVSSVV